jgi:hypothetical protein
LNQPAGYRAGDFNMDTFGLPDDNTNYWLPNANKAWQVPGSKELTAGYQSQIPK